MDWDNLRYFLELARAARWLRRPGAWRVEHYHRRAASRRWKRDGCSAVCVRAGATG